MATPQALTALIRATKPEYKSTAEKVVLAVHAVLSINGFSLRKVGDGVDQAVAQGASALPHDEVDLTGWNRLAEGDGAAYSFLYVPEPGAQRPQQQQAAPSLLLVKCLRLAPDAPPPPAPGGVGYSVSGGGGGASAGAVSGGVLLVSLADVHSGQPPVSLELQVDRYVPTQAPGAGGYEQLEELIGRVQGALAEVVEGGAASGPATGRVGTGAATAAAATGTVSSSQQQQRQREEEGEEQRRHLRDDDPLRDDRYRPAGLPTRGPPGWGPAMGVGDEDLMPGGLPRPPGLGGLGGPGFPGSVPLGPRGLGGGMHVGPDNPMFAARADRLRHPRGGPGFPPGPGGGGAVPGMRWDPISPEGLQGWSPDDFTRSGRAQHGEGFNDIGRPLPGRGPDWDSMFG